MLGDYLHEHYGDVASVVGLLVSLTGFIITIINVRKAKKAAEEARQAAREAVSKIKSQVLATEIGTSLQWIRELDRACRDHQWEEALNRCDNARTHLARICDNTNLTNDERALLNSGIRVLGDILPYVQKIRQTDPQREISAQKMKRLHDIIIMLSQIQGRLQTESPEV